MRKWKLELKERYEQLTAATFATTPLKYEVKYVSEKSNLGVAHSSSGRGHRPLKAEITGSNPVCATIDQVRRQIKFLVRPINCVIRLLCA